jgi:hypothetical protein
MYVYICLKSTFNDIEYMFMGYIYYTNVFFHEMKTLKVRNMF